jgi:hypothetical protein
LEIPAASAGSRGLHLVSQKNVNTPCLGDHCWLEEIVDPR